MTIHLLDTDTFTLAYYGKRGVRERIAAVRTPDLVAVSIVTRIEVLLGRLEAVLKAATAAAIIEQQGRLKLSEEFLGRFPLLPFETRAGPFFDQHQADGRFRKKRADLLIACVAQSYNAILVTRNTKDFAHVPGLKLDNWAG